MRKCVSFLCVSAGSSDRRGDATSAFGGMAWLGGMEFVRGHAWGRRRPGAFLEGRREDLIMHEEFRERHVEWWAVDVIDTGMSYICWNVCSTYRNISLRFADIVE